MNGEFLGGGLVFAVGAVLWVAYLIPSWLRRRHFKETEANTVRMQHTVAAMAVAGLDTSHLRQAEATARAVHEQKKALRQAERAGKRMARTSAIESLTPEQQALMAGHRRRRARQTASGFLLASLATLAVGIAYIVYVGDILIALLGIVATLVTLVVMSSMSKPATSTTARRVVAPAVVFDQGVAPASVTRSWTPQAVPRSLQQSPGSVAASVVAQQEAADARRRAMAEQAYLASIAALTETVASGAQTTASRAVPAVSSAGPVAVPNKPVSKFAHLGIVDDVDTGSFDLDSALKRRRVG
jgi:hypothetical protein